MIQVINMSKVQSSYRLRFTPDGHSLKWLATDGHGDVVLSREPEVKPLICLEILLLAPFVPEQLL
jgi:cardiolipin synthase C